MIKRFFKDVIYAIKDHKRDFQERVFILFTIISDIAVIIALIGDLIMGEDFKEIIVLVATIIGVPIITFTCMYKKRMKFAMRFIVITLVVVILPTLYFFGGGLCFSRQMESQNKENVKTIFRMGTSFGKIGKSYLEKSNGCFSNDSGGSPG